MWLGGKFDLNREGFMRVEEFANLAAGIGEPLSKELLKDWKIELGKLIIGLNCVPEFDFNDGEMELLEVKDDSIRLTISRKILLLREVSEPGTGDE